MRTRFARVLLIGGTFALSLICVTLLGWAQEATPQAPGARHKRGIPAGQRWQRKFIKISKCSKASRRIR